MNGTVPTPTFPALPKIRDTYRVKDGDFKGRYDYHYAADLGRGGGPLPGLFTISCVLPVTLEESFQVGDEHPDGPSHSHVRQKAPGDQQSDVVLREAGCAGCVRDCD